MKNKIICGIYKITNPSEKIYIGESKDIDSRIYYYKINSCVKQRKLFNSLKKYGWDAHKFEIIEECEVSELYCRERYWQDHYEVIGKNGLNLKLTNCGDVKVEMSQETKDRISLKNKGSNNGMYGKVLTKAKKEARRDYKHSEDSLNKIQQRSYRGNNPGAKIILNLETGIFYDCVADAADTIGKNRDTLKQQLNGRRKNYTSFIYVENYGRDSEDPAGKVGKRYILDTSNGVFYESTKEAYLYYDFSYFYLLRMLNVNSSVRNTTTLIYV